MCLNLRNVVPADADATFEFIDKKLYYTSPKHQYISVIWCYGHYAQNNLFLSS